MTELAFPPIEAILDLHAEWLELFGGAAGMRDRGALEGSLARGRQILAYQPDTDIASLAAAICVSICRNHPFVDGNKRAAFGTLGVVLGMNDHYLDVAETEATRAVLALAAGDMPEEDFRQWVLAHTYLE